MSKCANCGFDSDALNVKPMNNFMNEYVDSVTGKVECVQNSDAKELEIKGKKLTRKDLWKKPEAPKVVEVPKE